MLMLHHGRWWDDKDGGGDDACSGAGVGTGPRVVFVDEMMIKDV
jgi:hypothetical protein